MTTPYSPDDHFEHGRHNEAFADLLISAVLKRQPEYTDWALVAIAYAALHYTEGALLRDHGVRDYKHVGYMDRQGVHHDGHDDYMRQYLPGIVAAYREIFDRGWEARYRGYYKKGANFVLEVVRQRALLDDIKAACGI